MDWSEYFRTHGDFVLAQLTGGEAVYVAANNVQCIIGDRVMTVDALMFECSKHSWNRQIYEAWVYETKNRAMALANQLTGYEKEALLYVLSIEMAEEGSYGQAMEAINQVKAIVEAGMKPVETVSA